MIKRITINLFSLFAFFMALQIVGFSYSASKSFSFMPQETLQEEEVHKYCEAQKLIEDSVKYPTFNLTRVWPEQFLKDSIDSSPTTPPPRHLFV